MLSLLHSPTLTSIHDHRKTIALTRWTFVDKVMSLLFNMLTRLVITFLPRSKRLLISWLQSPSAVILEPRKIKSDPDPLFPHLSPYIVTLFILFYFIFYFFFTLQYCIGFAIHQYESATGVHMFQFHGQRSLVGCSPWDH